jgi:predicted DNA-binding WGR domain protein
MTSIYLERREPTFNRQRFYIITLTRTLFGRWTLIREWGWVEQIDPFVKGMRFEKPV